MKIFQKFIILFLLFGTMACEEVVEIDLEDSEPRLVIEASLVWDIHQIQNPLFIRLSTTAPYFDEEIPPAENAEVRVFDSAGNEYVFDEIETGLFKNDGFAPEADMEYELEVIYQDEVYRATESLVSTSEIESIEQDNNGGFTGEEIELKAFYTDPEGKGNYYLFRFFHEEELSIQIFDDELIDGNRTFAFFSDDELDAGDKVTFELQGISEGFYEYLFILRSQAGSGGGPFQTQPTIVRGNIINTTSPENFAFGYFRLSERDVESYVIQ